MEQKLLKFFLLFLTAFTWAAEPFKVGMELTYPPFETVDKYGNPTGISVDLAYALGNYLNKTTIIENIPFVGLIPALKSHKIDAIISSMSITEERKKSIDFSAPYLKVGLCLLISKKSSMKSIADAPGKIIVVKLGSTGQVYAEEHLKQSKILILDKESSCVLEVVQGKADAFIYDQFSINTHWKKNLDTTRANLDPFVTESWGIGVRKEDKELLNQINTFLKNYNIRSIPIP